MQSAEAAYTKKSLLLAVKRYSSAVSAMEQTVLLPSMLRDVPADPGSACSSADTSEDEEEEMGDLYSHYLMLKAIRNTVENGLVTMEDDHSVNINNSVNNNSMALSQTLEPLMDTDPEALFRFHLGGLFSVMSDLTKKTQGLTEKYMDIIGVTN